jgi:uncharacterized protein YbbK (DUF523 family)/uncharacterized protein YbgA (DUF1722 family)
VNESNGRNGPVRVAVSACLLGYQVRYDGSHKRHPFITETLARFIELVPVCPEAELGLGVPRETLRLERRGNDIRMIGNHSEQDHTLAMCEYARQRLDMLAHLQLCGYILKQGSPSCSLEVTIFGDDHSPGRGLFAAALAGRWPLLPVVEETCFTDSANRAHFLERIFAYHRLRSFFRSSWTRAGLIGFQQMHELQLLAHSRRWHGELSRLVHAACPSNDLRLTYERRFMRAMSSRATPQRHARVLRQIADRLRLYLDPLKFDMLDQAIRDYQVGNAPFSAPIILIHRYAQQFEIDSLRSQTYLEPYPLELLAHEDR